eukprot:gene18273-49137_t
MRWRWWYDHRRAARSHRASANMDERGAAPRRAVNGATGPGSALLLHTAGGHSPHSAGAGRWCYHRDAPDELPTFLGVALQPSAQAAAARRRAKLGLVVPYDP